LRDDYLAGLNQPSVGIGSAILFRDFARIYERDVLSTHASTTQDIYQQIVPESQRKAVQKLTNLVRSTAQQRAPAVV